MHIRPPPPSPHPTPSGSIKIGSGVAQKSPNLFPLLAHQPPKHLHGMRGGGGGRWRGWKEEGGDRKMGNGGRWGLGRQVRGGGRKM
jgi:hypothetical protein